jgi:hypothetical protein
MDWDEIIERNRGRILAAIAPLLGFDPGRRAQMPRYLCRALLTLLRPAESAARRLIIIAARGIAVKLRLGAPRAFPKGLAMSSDAQRIAAFCLIDPLKRSAPEGFGWSKDWSRQWGRQQAIPRISVPGLFDPVFPVQKRIPCKHDPISTAALLARIEALKSALANLPREARRLARWKARGELARQGAHKPHRLSPLRPGGAPGLHRHKPRDIDAILADSHYFAVEAWDRPDTS